MIHSVKLWCHVIWWILRNIWEEIAADICTVQVVPRTADFSYACVFTSKHSIITRRCEPFTGWLQNVKPFLSMISFTIIPRSVSSTVQRDECALGSPTCDSLAGTCFVHSASSAIVIWLNYHMFMELVVVVSNRQRNWSKKLKKVKIIVGLFYYYAMKIYTGRESIGPHIPYCAVG